LGQQICALVRRHVSGGPAAARNAGAAATTAPVLAFCDSDTRPTPAALRRLLAHLDDPAVGIVGPRVIATEDVRETGQAVDPPRILSGLIGHYERVRSPLDIGPREGLAQPGQRPAYLPSTVLVVRRSAFVGFDEALRLGEDVDLCWRTAAEIRYEPSVRVGHEHRNDPAAWFRRRFDYGTSVGTLGRRYPEELAFAVLHPASLTPLVALTWPPLAGVLVGARVARLARRLAPYGVPATEAARVVGDGLATTGRTLGALALGPWLPVTAAALVGRRTRRRAAVLLGAALLDEWLRLRPALGPGTYTAIRLLDGDAGAAGTCWGCVRERTVRPLLPRVTGPTPPSPRWMHRKARRRSACSARARRRTQRGAAWG
jgi:mycofactocin system glycosyltransferase